ncbi:MAG: hypothetical protein CUN52_01730 [Phototrophicales bacterium]|nr:MAG: hypothetical protein CUN52_01730 [Phototrophicales bacterium]
MTYISEILRREVIECAEYRCEYCLIHQADSKHFRLDGAVIIPMTPEGRVTVFLLKLNDQIRLRARRILVGVGRYPPK